MQQSDWLTNAARALMAAGLLALGCAEAASGLAGSEAPDFVLKSLSGSNIRLSEYRGRIVMLVFWASWCGDCRGQLETLADVYESYHEAGFDVLAVNLDRDERQAREAAQGWQADYPILYDAGGEVGRSYDVGAMPLAVLIDRDGVIREVVRGFGRGQGEEYLERVRALLRE